MRSHVFHRSAALLAVPALAIGVAACSDTSASSKNTADRRPATQEIRSDAPPAHVVPDEPDCAEGTKTFWFPPAST